MEEMKGILSELKAKRRPILELLKERQARHEAYQEAKDRGDYSGESELGSTRAERRAEMENRAPGMNEGNVGTDSNLTQKILNFLRKKKFTPPGQERGAPLSMKGVKDEESPLPQPLSSEEKEELKANF